MPETETENPTVEPQDVGSETVEKMPSELMDMIIADESPSDIADRIKDMLYAKSSERVDAYRPDVATSTFNPSDTEAEVETEIQPEGGEE